MRSSRRKRRSLLRSEAALSIALATVVAAGCSSPPETAVLRRFFAAARLRDKTTLADFATVRFEPQIEGTIREFDVTGVDRVRRTPIARLADDSSRRPEGADRIVQMSAGSRRHDINLATYNGQLEAVDVTLEAPVRMPGGDIVPKRLLVTLQRTVLRADPDVVGAWIVTDIRVLGVPSRR